MVEPAPSQPLLQPYENLVDILLNPAYARSHLSLFIRYLAVQVRERSRPDVGVVRHLKVVCKTGRELLRGIRPLPTADQQE